MPGVPARLRWDGQQLSRVPGPSRPIDEITVLLELCNLSKPLCPVLIRDSYHIVKITRS
jgi:hypothetical protein